MSDHTWSQERIAAYLAGGLPVEEMERLDRHARDCAGCEAALSATQHLDRGLSALFEPLRPRPGLEDRAVRAVRIAPKPRVVFLVGWPRRAVGIAACLIIVMAFGALAASMMTGGRMPLPGMSLPKMESFAMTRREASARSPGAPPAWAHEESGQTVEARGLTAPSPGMKPLTEEDVNGVVTTDPVGVAGDLPREATSSTTRPQYLEQKDKPAQEISQKAIPSDSAARSYAWPGPPPPGSLDPRRTSPAGKPGSKGGAMGGMNGGMMGMMGGGMMGIRGGMMGMTGAQASGAAASPGYFVPGSDKAKALQSVRDQLAQADKDSPSLKGTKSKGRVSPAPSAPPAPSARGEAPTPGPQPARRIVVRSGDIEFEIESFDSALAAITKLVTGIKGAFVGTVNSDKLANGKVKGTIVVRTPPESLDGLVLDLRKELGKGGEIKHVKLASADITKQYTDLESRLRAARAMESRLLDIIKTGKGEIKQLLEAERELGVWRTKIEETEGELRYYANLAALSTLTITLVEKEIRAAALITENERVEAGVEVEDVDKAYQQLLKEVVAAKGRVRKSELKQLSAGQFNATLKFDVSPESSGPIRDRLRQLGRVARLEIGREEHAEAFTPTRDAKVKRGDSAFTVQLYNLANVAPRETATLSVAVADVPSAYNALRDAIAKAAARVRNAHLNERDRQNITAQIDFDVKRTEQDAIRKALAAAGEATARTVARAPESDAVTDTKIQYRVTLFPVQRLLSRETATLSVAVADVPAAYNAMRDALTKAAARVQNAQLNEKDRENITAQLDFDVKRVDEEAIRKALAAAGEATSRTVARAPESDTVTDTKILYRVTLFPVQQLRPRDTITLSIAVANVPSSYLSLRASVLESKGRVLSSHLNENDKRNVSAGLDFEVQRTEEAAVKAALEAAGETVSRQITHPAANEAATDSKVLYILKLLPANSLKPRETTTLALEVPDVDRSVQEFIAEFNQAKGKQIDASTGRERSGKVSARLVYEAPLDAAAGLVERFKSEGTVRVLNTSRDPRAPEGKSATARIEITLTKVEGIVSPDDGLWPPVKKGLSYSASVLLTSMTWVVFGLCVLLPWAVVGYGGYRVVRHLSRSSPADYPPASAAPSPPVSPEAGETA